jgi:hypothetical protein
MLEYLVLLEHKVHGELQLNKELKVHGAHLDSKVGEQVVNKELLELRVME